MRLTALFVCSLLALPAAAQNLEDFQLGVTVERAMLCELHIDADLVYAALINRGELTDERRAQFDAGTQRATVAWQVSSDTCKMAERRAHEAGIMAKWKR